MIMNILLIFFQSFKIKIIGKYLEKETDWARTYQKTVERLYGLESNREAEADL